MIRRRRDPGPPAASGILPCPKGSAEDFAQLLAVHGAVRFAIPQGYWCYLLTGHDGLPFYPGITGNLMRRLGEHLKAHGNKIAGISVIQCRSEHEARVLQFVFADRFEPLHRGVPRHRGLREVPGRPAPRGEGHGPARARHRTPGRARRRPRPPGGIMKYPHSLPRPWRGYAAWCRRQASTTNCGPGPAAAGLVALGVIALGTVLLIERYLQVIEHTVLAALGVTAVAVLTYIVLAAGEARARRWRRTRCEDCAAAKAIAVVTYANGPRGDTVRTCGPCWKAAERAATATAGTGSTWDWDRSGPGLPRITEVPPVLVREGIPGLSAPAPDLAASWLAAEAAQLRDGRAVAPDNEPASDEHTAAELARVLEQAAPEPPRIIPPSQWTRSHP